MGVRLKPDPGGLLAYPSDSRACLLAFKKSSDVFTPGEPQMDTD